MKEYVQNLTMCKTNDKQLMKNLKHYSLLKIQDGHFEYQEILEFLKTENNKTNNSKS